MIRNRTSSLQKRESAKSIKSTKSPVSSITSEFKKVNVQARPPKPSMAPPPLNSEKPVKVPVHHTKSLDVDSRSYKKQISKTVSCIVPHMLTIVTYLSV